MFFSYPFSYKISGGEFDQNGVTPLGVASIIYSAEIGSAAPNRIIRVSDFKNPSSRFMTIENEDGLLLGNSGGFTQPLVTSGWIYIDPLGTRHNGRSTTSLLDGHVELVRPAVGLEKERWDPRF